MRPRTFFDFVLTMTLLALIFSMLMFYSKNKQTKNKTDVTDATPKSHIENEDLQHFYDAMNDVYYNGKLPKAVVRFAPNIHGLDDNGKDVPAVGLYTPNDPPEILIDEIFKDYPVVAFETETHEQCHVAVDTFHPEFESHGPMFQGCMLRLGQMGALKYLW